MSKETSFENPPEGHIALLGYDSDDKKWYALAIDENGVLQLGTITIGLPSGAATALKQLANDHDVNVSNMITGFATALKQLANDHDVNVSNMISGFATATKQLANGHGVSLDGEGLQLRRGDHTVATYDAVPGDTNTHDLLSVSGAGVLEHISLASDHASSAFLITIDGDVISVVDVATPDLRASIRPLYLSYGTFEDSLFKLIAHDTGNDYYGIMLKRPLWFNSTLAVQYRGGSVTAKVSVIVGYHRF